MCSAKILGISLILTLAIGCQTPYKEQRSDIAAIEKGLSGPVSIAGEDNPRYNLKERMELYHVPGVSVAVIREGKLEWVRTYGIANTETGSEVDTNCLFQAGSISKPVAALAVLKLMEEGKVDLDADVNNYLTSWQLPANIYTDSSKVSLRKLLNHTAGLTIHGFPGYETTETMPSTLSVLKGEGNTEAVVSDTIPGTNWRYSGGGYTLMQLVVEDVTGMPFDQYMDQEILPALGMRHSTYSQPLKEDFHEFASAAYDRRGELYPGLWHNYPEKAAAGLWTTPADLARYCLRIQEILDGDTSGPIRPETARMIIEPGLNEWGLGPALSGKGDSIQFRHGGKNAGFTNVFVATAYQGTGAIIMTNADQGGRLMSEILRSISEEYGWDFARQEEISRMDLSDQILADLAGEYFFLQADGESRYWVSLVSENGGLSVVDTNNGERDFLVPIDSLEFIQAQTADRMRFTVGDGRTEFVWNDTFMFLKAE